MWLGAHGGERRQERLTIPRQFAFASSMSTCCFKQFHSFLSLFPSASFLWFLIHLALSHTRVYAPYSYHFDIRIATILSDFFHNYIYFFGWVLWLCVSVFHLEMVSHTKMHTNFMLASLLNSSSTTWFMCYCACFNLIFLSPTEMLLLHIFLWFNFVVNKNLRYFICLHTFYLWHCFLPILWIK